MKVEILDAAQEDLVEGFQFYETREAGVGSHFLDCLFSDIDSLLLYAGILGLTLSASIGVRRRLNFSLVLSAAIGG